MLLILCVVSLQTQALRSPLTPSTYSIGGIGYQPPLERLRTALSVLIRILTLSVCASTAVYVCAERHNSDCTLKPNGHVLHAYVRGRVPTVLCSD
jgi:hypothetical protein